MSREITIDSARHERLVGAFIPHQKYPFSAYFKVRTTIIAPPPELVFCTFWKSPQEARRAEMGCGRRMEIELASDGHTLVDQDGPTLVVSPLDFLQILCGFVLYRPNASSAQVWRFAYSVFGFQGRQAVDGAFDLAMAAAHGIELPGYTGAQRRAQAEGRTDVIVWLRGRRD